MRWIDNPINIGYKVMHDHMVELRWRIDQLQEDQCPTEHSGVESSALATNLFTAKENEYIDDQMWFRYDVETYLNTNENTDDWPSHLAGNNSLEDLGHYTTDDPSHDGFFKNDYDSSFCGDHYGVRDSLFFLSDLINQLATDNSDNNTGHEETFHDGYDVGINSPHNYPHSPTTDTVHRDIHYEGWCESLDTPDYDSHCVSVYNSVYGDAYETHCLYL